MWIKHVTPNAKNIQLKATQSLQQEALQIIDPIPEEFSRQNVKQKCLPDEAILPKVQKVFQIHRWVQENSTNETLRRTGEEHKRIAIHQQEARTIVPTAWLFSRKPGGGVTGEMKKSERDILMNHLLEITVSLHFRHISLDIPTGLTWLRLRVKARGHFHS